MESNDIKFLADASLAGLSRWLRLLGYDTAVFTAEAGRSMLRKAAEEGRIVLTRRRDMTQRQFSGIIFLVLETQLGKQLKAVIEKFPMKIDTGKMFGICLECNEKLFPVEKSDVRDRVPAYVLEYCDQYNRCPRCRKIYWMGTHPENALRFLRKHIPNHLP